MNSITLLKIKTFLNSFWWHVWLGFPKSTQKQIEYRLAICLECEKYDPINKECSVCGCNINNRRMFMNKLAWADQKCPIGKWDSLA